MTATRPSDAPCGPQDAGHGSEAGSEGAEPPQGDTALRDRIAEAVGLARNGPASDGRGWYRTAGDRLECYAIADAVLPVVEAEIAEQTQRAEQAEELLRIAHDTSNRSEAERARAVQRAEEAEADARRWHMRFSTALAEYTALTKRHGAALDRPEGT